ncbi:hypothetical protein Patl1_26575 [Pistacia atlantica]|uniref:Uncharacterized protein n=1 Tax=Pistacia atlantica TaxID=434234 RepID=A0ACC1B4N5_9ROSI|nr:hypothetical protein Patl1_26575 [Pistacia atlantica]
MERRRRIEDTILLQIVLFSLFLLLNSAYGIYSPRYFFTGNTPLCQAFLICIVFSFSGAFCALLVGKRPQFATIQRFYSILSMVSMSLALLLPQCDLFLRCFIFASSSKFLKNEEGRRFLLLRRIKFKYVIRRPHQLMQLQIMQLSPHPNHLVI